MLLTTIVRLHLGHSIFWERIQHASGALQALTEFCLGSRRVFSSRGGEEGCLIQDTTVWRWEHKASQQANEIHPVTHPSAENPTGRKSQPLFSERSKKYGVSRRACTSFNEAHDLGLVKRVSRCVITRGTTSGWAA